MQPKPLQFLALAAMVGLLVVKMSACGPGALETNNEERALQSRIDEHDPVRLDKDEKLRVVATTNIVGDVVSNVGGDHIDLTVLMGTGVDPHSYVPAPADTAAVHDAHAVFANGGGLEAKLDEMLNNAGGEAAYVEVSEGIQFHSLDGSDTHDEEGEDEPGHRDVDPHVWFSVPNVIHWVENIESSLSALDPANAGRYSDNADEYIQELAELDAWIQEQMGQIPEESRKFVTNHPAFGYLAERYGLQQVGAVYPVSPSSEPSAQDVAALEDAIREFGVTAVFAESTVNPKLAEQVAQDTGVRLVPLYSGSLSESGGGAETYILMMRYNVDAIVKALRQ